MRLQIGAEALASAEEQFEEIRGALASDKPSSHIKSLKRTEHHLRNNRRSNSCSVLGVGGASRLVKLMAGEPSTFET